MMKTIRKKLNYLSFEYKLFLILGNVLSFVNLYKNPNSFILTAIMIMLTVTIIAVADMEEEQRGGKNETYSTNN